MKVVDLFCGCGGLSLGFMKAGFEIAAGFDFWDEAIEVYKKNFNHPVIKQNLMDVDEASEKIKNFTTYMVKKCYNLM